MKKDIHPKWYPECKVTCSCGNSFTVGSTKEEIKVDICSACHPFFTGTQKYVDTLGRVERFQAKQSAASKTPIVNKKQKKLLKKIEEDKKEAARPKSLREMFEKVKDQAKA